MSNREIKLKLYQENPRCHWCQRETILTNIPEIHGDPNPLMATIDHLVSRYHPERWVKRDVTKVLACYECNARRAREETLALSRQEIIERSRGFSLNKRGNPIFIESLDTIDQVLDRMKEHGINLFNDGCGNTTVPQQGRNDSCATEASGFNVTVGIFFPNDARANG